MDTIAAGRIAKEDDTTCSTDVNEVECPWCGGANQWQDLQTDGCLEEGRAEDCAHCGKEIVIDAVDWEPVIWCKKGGAK